MNFKRVIAASVLASFAGAAVVAIAGPPPLDRPSPPACCADGVCYPNPGTFGVYRTRWRRGPGEELEPIPAATPPGGQVPEAPPFEPIQKEDEDRAAPPPTKAAERAREEEEEGAAPPAGEQPGGLPVMPPAGLPQLPSGEGRPEVPTMEMPWDLPATPPTETTPGPTGDLDPPPAPPFATPALVNGPAIRAAERPAPQPEPRRTTPVIQPRGNDPPPAFPIAYLGR
jgi:hypothetical protein